MTPNRRSRRPTLKSERRVIGSGFAVGWHLAWAAGVAATGAALVAAGRLTPDLQLAPFAIGVVPGLAGAVLARGGSRTRTAAVLIWTLAAIVAVLMTGGASGPLAAWSLAPLAAAAAFRKPDLLPLAAAGGLAAAAVAALSSVLLPLPTVAPAAAAWLNLAGLTGMALALGVALVMLYAEAIGERRARDDIETGLLEVLDNQPQLLVDLYPGGRILEAFGQPPPGWRVRDLIERNLGDFVHADDRPAVEDALQRAVGAGSAEIAFRPAYDSEGWWELSLRRMSTIRIVGAIRDARSQRAREAELEAARVTAEQQNAGKSRFLANMSHELRTPLNAIMGFSDIMRQRLFGTISDRYAEYADLIHESGSHLLELINDVLDMSKIEADRFELARENFDAREAVSAALRLMRGQADRAGVSLRGALPNEPLPANADRRAVKQIAINLVSNALKFTPRGGAVTLTLQGAGETLELIVADTGVGIAPDDLERLGRPFEQAGDPSQKAAGSGLGLSLVRAFAQLHGGEMCIESALGEGATVIVRMPVLNGAAVTPQSRPAPADV
ncbi:MAG TPA: PAS domain-containing sensor histidine kinase [Phenylobacterium sp.]|uniref:PAS domain-containing sensor histidine kinase n=1 Tax=Phenylobacterium sp. TaxID=1871053 RepID=UPI002B47EE12|nr:PAS domain-containing sensor histidine kinase [Phenylobacterium sp.]HKR86755.1 PAS domain-containing sensor histidine kinase [Phenylobacterium sp.]